MVYMNASINKTPNIIFFSFSTIIFILFYGELTDTTELSGENGVISWGASLRSLLDWSQHMNRMRRTNTTRTDPIMIFPRWRQKKPDSCSSFCHIFCFLSSAIFFFFRALGHQICSFAGVALVDRLVSFGCVLELFSPCHEDTSDQVGALVCGAVH